jgi:hypothetical protein
VHRHGPRLGDREVAGDAEGGGDLGGRGAHGGGVGQPAQGDDADGEQEQEHGERHGDLREGEARAACVTGEGSGMHAANVGTGRPVAASEERRQVPASASALPSHQLRPRR